jgi:hypothetical protein
MEWYSTYIYVLNYVCWVSEDEQLYGVQVGYVVGGVVASRGSWEQTKSKMALGLMVFLSLIWLCSCVCLYI